MAATAALLTSREVADLLRVHPKQVYRLLRRGLPARRVGAEWRFDRAEVMAWSGAEAPRAQPPSPSPDVAPPSIVAANGDVVVALLLRAANALGAPLLGFVQTDAARGIALLEQGAVLAVGAHAGGFPSHAGGDRAARVHLASREVGLLFRRGGRSPRLADLRRLGSRPGPRRPGFASSSTPPSSAPVSIPRRPTAARSSSTPTSTSCSRWPRGGPTWAWIAGLGRAGWAVLRARRDRGLRPHREGPRPRRSPGGPDLRGGPGPGLPRGGRGRGRLRRKGRGRHPLRRLRRPCGRVDAWPRSRENPLIAPSSERGPREANPRRARRRCPLESRLGRPSSAAEVPALYKKSCASCHGAEGKGGTARAIAGKPASAVAGVVNAHAPPMDKLELTPDQIAAIGRYVSSLKK